MSGFPVRARTRVAIVSAHLRVRVRSSLRFKLGVTVLLGMASMAVGIGALMFSTANALFVSQARAELQRQNDSVAHEIDNLTDRAAI